MKHKWSCPARGKNEPKFFGLLLHPSHQMMCQVRPGSHVSTMDTSLLRLLNSTVCGLHRNISLARDEAHEVWIFCCSSHCLGVTDTVVATDQNLVQRVTYGLKPQTPTNSGILFSDSQTYLEDAATVRSQNSNMQRAEGEENSD